MSDSETKGRCRSEVDMSGSGGPVTNAIADAIDRLAADVASVREAVCDRGGWPVGWLIEVHRLNQRRQEAIALADEARAEVERLRKELEQRQPAGNSPKTSNSSPAAPQPAGQGISPKVADTQPTGNAAPAPGWLTEREQHALRHILAADVEPAIRSILARAGSPPVVEVPELGFLGPMTGREQGIVLAYRDALDKAGIAWEEVGRE